MVTITVTKFENQTYCRINFSNFQVYTYNILLKNLIHSMYILKLIYTHKNSHLKITTNVKLWPLKLLPSSCTHAQMWCDTIEQKNTCNIVSWARCVLCNARAWRRKGIQEGCLVYYAAFLQGWNVIQNCHVTAPSRSCNEVKGPI